MRRVKTVSPNAPRSLNSFLLWSNAGVTRYLVPYFFTTEIFVITETVKYRKRYHWVQASIKKWTVPIPNVNPRINASQTAVYFDPTDPALHIILVTSDDDPSPSKASALIRPCWCKLRMESAMMRAVFFWYPPDVTMSMGTPRRLAALNTISSLFTMPWHRKMRKKLECQSVHSRR